jgi:hypothetical protein
MLSWFVDIALQPRRPLVLFPNLTPALSQSSSNSHAIISFADPYHLTPLKSYRLKNIGGWGCIPSTFGRSDLRTFRCVSGLSPFFSNSCALFCTSPKLNSFVFNRFRTLCRKPPGVGVGGLLAESKTANEPTQNAGARRVHWGSARGSNWCRFP